MTMLDVVPLHEFSSRTPGRVHVVEARSEKVRPVPRDAEQRVKEGMVATNPGSRVRRLDAQPVRHPQHGGGIQSRANVAVRCGFGLEGSNQPVAVYSRRLAHQMCGVFGGMSANRDSLATRSTFARSSGLKACTRSEQVAPGRPGLRV
ncbi:hypothetical protein H3V53_03630 [Paraburkholderia bengalensis]|uniref:Uncharacterized protein n=1 Tax=Paraburkholderia bengalensis TaxID=2747562 RepID=A0ABU8IL68_9BURK